MEKTCRKCSRVLPITDFYKLKTMADGHLNQCKDCIKEGVRANRAKNIETYREYDRERASLPHRVLERAKRFLAFKISNPEKRSAHNAVNNAVRDGRLKKEPCCVCGAEYVHAHHKDYAKPLDVVWLCPSHHKQLHAERFTLIVKHEF